VTLEVHGGKRAMTGAGLPLVYRLRTVGAVVPQSLGDVHTQGQVNVCSP